MNRADREDLSKEREVYVEEDATLPDAPQVDAEYNVHLDSAVYDPALFGNNPAIQSPGRSEAGNNDPSKAIISSVPTAQDWIVAGKSIACQNCQQRRGKCSGQDDRQPIQLALKCDYCARNRVQCVWKAPVRATATATSRRRPNTRGQAGSSDFAAVQGGRSQLQTKSACAGCQRRKQRCTGDRPACQSCVDKGIACLYDVADGKTRSEDLKFKVQEATERGDKLDQLVSAMRHGSCEESSALLARLRRGATLDELLYAETGSNHLPILARNPNSESSSASDFSRGTYATDQSL